MKWEKVKLSEVTEYITDGDHQPAPKSDSGVLFVKIKDIQDNRLAFDNALFVPQEYYNRLPKNRKAEYGDTLYTVVGSYGIPAFVNHNIPFCFERNIALLHPNNRVIPKYLYYAVNNPIFYGNANNIANGSAQKLIPLSKLAGMEISVPPIERQETIVNILSAYASELSRLMKYTDRGDIAPEVRTRYEAITAIYGELKKKRKTASNVDLMVEINNIISEYVHVEETASGIVLSRQFDISQIDFDLLRREFAETKKKNLVMKDLAELIRSRLDSMLLNNPDRIIYHERYQQIIEDYNSQQDRATIEKTFDELMQIVKDMDQEERRYVREGFSSDEELSLYDMLFSENLSKQDIRKIKAVAVELLQKVKSKIAELDHWTDKQETRSIVYNLIRDDLWSELPACYDEPSISVYLQRIYEYVYKRYKEVA